MYWQGETYTFCSPFRPKVLASGGNPKLPHFTHQPTIEPPHIYIHTVIQCRHMLHLHPNMCIRTLKPNNKCMGRSQTLDNPTVKCLWIKVSVRTCKHICSPTDICLDVCPNTHKCTQVHTYPNTCDQNMHTLTHIPQKGYI